jgi:FlaA1/EpsC-like NDP-sugar epimerase
VRKVKIDIERLGNDSVAGVRRPILEVPWLRRLAVATVHVFLWGCACLLALTLRFEGAIPAPVVSASSVVVETLILFRLLSFFKAGLFDGLFRYSGLPELKKLIGASTAATFLAYCAYLLYGHQGVPRSLFVGEWFASIVLIGGTRMLIRTMYEGKRRGTAGTPVLVIGAGDAGESLVRELQRMRDGAAWKVVGFLDDSPSKQGRLVHQVPVLGPADEATLRRVVQRHHVELVVLAMPTAAGERTRGLVRMCRSLGIRAKTVPSLAERMTGETLEAVREIKLEDLLRRDPVQLDLEQVAGFLKD